MTAYRYKPQDATYTIENTVPAQNSDTIWRYTLIDNVMASNRQCHCE